MAAPVCKIRVISQISVISVLLTWEEDDNIDLSLELFLENLEHKQGGISATPLKACHSFLF
jgi:hypothetical protein